jgi:hypothetical protein
MKSNNNYNNNFFVYILAAEQAVRISSAVSGISLAARTVLSLLINAVVFPSS